MSIALGAYLKALREGRGLKVIDVRTEIARRMGTDADSEQTRVWRTENPGEGRGWPDGDYLIAHMDIVGAALRDVAWFQQHPEATAAQGIERARRRLDMLRRLEDQDDLPPDSPDGDIAHMEEVADRLTERRKREVVSTIAELLGVLAPDDGQPVAPARKRRKLRGGP